MKLTAILAALAVTATTAFANPTPEGCETKEVANGNYFNLVDATCVAFNPGRDFDYEAPEPEEEGEGEGETPAH